MKTETTEGDEALHKSRRRFHRHHHTPILRILGALVVTALIIVSLVFTVLAITDSDWAHRDLLFTDDENNNYNLRIPRSPFVNCEAVMSSIPHPPPPPPPLPLGASPGNESSTTAALATSTTASTTALIAARTAASTPIPTDHYFLNCSSPLCDLDVSDNPHLCQQLSLSRGVIYASVSLISFTLFLAILLTVTLFLPARPSGHSRRATFDSTISFVSFLTYSVLLAALATGLLGHYLGWSAAVDQQLPNGNQITQTSSIPPSQLPPTAQLSIPWIAGKSNVWMALGWGFAALGAIGWVGVWGVGGFELRRGEGRRWGDEGRDKRERVELIAEREKEIGRGTNDDGAAGTSREGEGELEET